MLCFDCWKASEVEAMLADYRHRTDEVRAQTACFISSQPVCDVVARIEDGMYSGLLHANTNGAHADGASNGNQSAR